MPPTPIQASSPDRPTNASTPRPSEPISGLAASSATASNWPSVSASSSSSSGSALVSRHSASRVTMSTLAARSSTVQRSGLSAAMS